MTIQVKLFAMLKEIMGVSELSIVVSEKISCREILTFLEQRDTRVRPLLAHALIAVNGRYADLETYLQADDEVAILPPVSGG